MMFEAPQTVRSRAGEVSSPPVVRLSSIRTHSAGLWASFHNPLRKPQGYTLLSISPLRTPLLPASFLTLASVSHLFSLQSRNIPRRNLRLPASFPPPPPPARHLPPLPLRSTPPFFFCFTCLSTSPPPLAEKERGFSLLPSGGLTPANKPAWEKENAENYSGRRTTFPMTGGGTL